jgi:hypothetical protein
VALYWQALVIYSIEPFGLDGSLRLKRGTGFFCSRETLHAFNEQSRFTAGGLDNLPSAFWRSNGDDVSRVKRTLAYFIHGTPNDFEYRFGYRRQFALISASYAKLRVGMSLAGSLTSLNYAYLS